MPKYLATKQYSPRLTPDESSILRIRVEAALLAELEVLQSLPEFRIKGTRTPSRSLLIRRCIAHYTESVKRMESHHLATEGDKLHRLT